MQVVTTDEISLTNAVKAVQCSDEGHAENSKYSTDTEFCKIVYDVSEISFNVLIYIISSPGPPGSRVSWNNFLSLQILSNLFNSRQKFCCPPKTAFIIPRLALDYQTTSK